MVGICHCGIQYSRCPESILFIIWRYHQGLVELLRGQIQGVCTEGGNKILTNIFCLLPTVKDKSDSYLAGALVFSTVKIFQKLLENQTLKTDLNGYGTSIQILTTEINSIIEKPAAEQTSGKFSKDMRNITACLITITQRMLHQTITKIHMMKRFIAGGLWINTFFKLKAYC